VIKRLSGLVLALAFAVPIGGASVAAQTGAPIEGACDPGRVRQDVKSLTSDQKAAIVDAMHAMKAMASPYDKRYTYYDQFVRWHQMAVMVSTSNDGVGIAHHNPAFPPWHRKFLWLFENGLCKASGDPTLALPYWDWTDPSSTAATFADDFMGPGGERENGYVVTEGPFNRDVWQLNILPSSPSDLAASPQKFLVRALGVDTASATQLLLPTIANVIATMEQTTYDTAPWGVNSAGSFRATLEGWVLDRATGVVDPDKHAMHNVVHEWVGGVFYVSPGTGELIEQRGTMTDLDVSPGDPLFFLHHANIDRVWASWQVDHPGPDNYLPIGGADECPFASEDDVGPGASFPKVLDEAHVSMTAHHTDEGPWPGQRLDDQMYPFCLERYEGTLVHEQESPLAQLDISAQGFTYEDLYTIPSTG